MTLVLALFGALSVGVAIWVAMNVVSDIQLGLVATLFVGGVVLFGLAYAVSILREILDRTRR